MKKQDYSNHIRFYAPHHFIYLPLLFILLGTGLWMSFASTDQQIIWILFSAVIFLLTYLAVMIRQHYALTLQDRLLRLEFKQRYFELFGKRSDDVENQLSFGQIAALRFAHDGEFRELLEMALADNTSPKEIKKAIKNWKPDYRRV
ncbi:DUF6526 family protein [Chryseobacterium sp.]|uniref:DUF6526 family protein n=1 Tax=Chryseobacterium sp. TaxID=1871047 RepID=UPI0012AA2F50|nr:DUF6526 family protein [Chryseobacterium sp.]QFG53024.1 hypothetical protein F7R58_05500 [Chryseobacterium sp.]